MHHSNKKQLRDKLLMDRAELTEPAWRTRSQQLQKRILELPQWRQARCVLLYMAFRQEADTRLLFQDSLQRHETTLLPRCVKGKKELELIAVSDAGQLSAGAYGIPEPDPVQCPAPSTLFPELAILPAVGFDKQGFRLGYGGGYYDRLLESGRLDNALCVGLGFDFQLLDTLPTEPWDKPVHAICTEERIVWM